MREVIATLTSKGQVTIPIEIRRHLGIEQGGKLSFVIGDDGHIQLKVPKYPTIASLAGAAGSLKEPMSFKEMREIAYEDHFEAKYKDV